MDKEPMQNEMIRQNRKFARHAWGKLTTIALRGLEELTSRYSLSVSSGDLLLIDGKWYVTHSGLLRVARQNRCAGISVQPVGKFCDPAKARWTFRATVYRNRSCKGFVGFGDADPSNVSSLVSGAEMRVAETRAVNRALRKAYGIGLCSVEEISSSPSLFSGTTAQSQKGKLPSGNGQPLLRDRLRQLIVQHQLDPVLVKAYALDFCGAKTLAEASREQIESFVQQLATKAQTDLKELRGLLDGYGPRQEVA